MNQLHLIMIAFPTASRGSLGPQLWYRKMVLHRLWDEAIYALHLTLQQILEEEKTEYSLLSTESPKDQAALTVQWPQ